MWHKCMSTTIKYPPARRPANRDIAASGRVELGEVRARPPEARRRGGPAGIGFLQWQRGRTEGAFGRDPADDPMSPPAARAVIDFAIVIDGMIAPRVRVERGAAGPIRLWHILILCPFPSGNERRGGWVP